MIFDDGLCATICLCIDAGGLLKLSFGLLTKKELIDFVAADFFGWLFILSLDLAIVFVNSVST